MDYFTYFIIRPELMAITSLQMPNPTEWVFSTLSNIMFDTHNLPSDRTTSGGLSVERVTLDEWVTRGMAQMRGGSWMLVHVHVVHAAVSITHAPVPLSRPSHQHTVIG